MVQLAVTKSAASRKLGHGQLVWERLVGGPDPTFVSGFHPSGGHGSRWAGWSSWTQGRERRYGE